MRWLILIAVLELTQSLKIGQPIGDPCRKQIPHELGLALERRFPQNRLPLLSDSGREDVQYNQTRGGTGCLLVARADFDGDGREDAAVGLPSRASRSPRVAVALRRDAGWAISTLRDFVDDVGRLYVDSVPPGKYTRAVELDSPLEPNERESLRCDHAAVVVGATESTGIANCYVKGRWLYVWFSD